jgi:hypothetical protein
MSWFDDNTPAADPNAGGMTTGTYNGGGAYPLASVMAPGLLQPWTTPFVEPTAEDVKKDPGYAFNFDEGIKAMQKTAAAGGTLLTGGLQKDLTKWAQDYASTGYGAARDRALQDYQLAYSAFENNQAKQYQRLMGVSSQGESAAAGQAAAAGDYANQGGNLITGVGNAGAAGTVGAGNAWGQGISGATNSLSDAMLFKYWQDQVPKPVTTSGYLPSTPLASNYATFAPRP